MGDDKSLLMFFYGTLKRGHRNHDHFCRGARFVDEATVRGRLYDLPFGYPALVVPEEDVFAVGTGDSISDAAVQRRLGRERAVVQQTGGPRVFGELFAFDDPEVGIPWPGQVELFPSERDRSAPRLREIAETLPFTYGG